MGMAIDYSLLNHKKKGAKPHKARYQNTPNQKHKAPNHLWFGALLFSWVGVSLRTYKS